MIGLEIFRRLVGEPHRSGYSWLGNAVAFALIVAPVVLKFDRNTFSMSA